MRSGFLLLAGVIPHRAPSKPREKFKRNFDGYLQIVANELKVMDEGFLSLVAHFYSPDILHDCRFHGS